MKKYENQNYMFYKVWKPKLLWNLSFLKIGFWMNGKKIKLDLERVGHVKEVCWSFNKENRLKEK